MGSPIFILHCHKGLIPVAHHLPRQSEGVMLETSAFNFLYGGQFTS